MIVLTKDGIINRVHSDIQASAYKSNGWKVVETVVEDAAVPAANEPVPEPAVDVAEAKARKKPGRKQRASV